MKKRILATACTALACAMALPMAGCGEGILPGGGGDSTELLFWCNAGLVSQCCATRDG